MSPKPWNHTEVKCLAGFRANERPLSFLVGEAETEVRTVVESWREPDYLYFKVETGDGRVYILRHHEVEDFWEARESASTS
jgi:hypothetical protein